MSRPAGRPILALFWRLYIVLGLICAGAGAYILWAPRAIGIDAISHEAPVRTVGIILLLFGIIRVANSVVQLRRFRS